MARRSQAPILIRRLPRRRHLHLVRRLNLHQFPGYGVQDKLKRRGVFATQCDPVTNGTDLSKIEILVILIINVLRLSDAAKSCLSP